MFWNYLIILPQPQCCGVYIPPKNSGYLACETTEVFIVSGKGRSDCICRPSITSSMLVVSYHFTIHLYWDIPPGMVFDHSGFCLPDKGQGRNPHFRWEHLASSCRLGGKEVGISSNSGQVTGCFC